jgi:hypothetical protein
VGDLDGDGIPDLAVADDDANVSVLLNQGNGTFSAPINYAAGGSSLSLAVGDLNGDGRLDIALGNDDGMTVLLTTCLP